MTQDPPSRAGRSGQPGSRPCGPGDAVGGSSGTALFVLVAVGVLGAAVLTLTGSGGGDKEAAPTSSDRCGDHHDCAVPPAGPFALTDGVNVRAGPGTTYPSAGTMADGNQGDGRVRHHRRNGQRTEGADQPVGAHHGHHAGGLHHQQYVDTGATIDDRS